MPTPHNARRPWSSIFSSQQKSEKPAASRKRKRDPFAVGLSVEPLEARRLLSAVGLQMEHGGEPVDLLSLANPRAFDLVNPGRGRIELAEGEMVLLATGPDPREFRRNV